jgi:hypothetical protein
MNIPDWLKDVTNDKKPAVVKKAMFNEEAYKALLAKASEGKFDESKTQALGEITELLKVVDNAVESLSNGLTKKAAPLMPPASMPAPAKKKKNVLPPKIKEPETSKWKEIKFNKRTGTWQVVVTQRHVRNFLSENEAIDFTKKASLVEKKASKASLLLGLICALSGCASTKELSRADVEREWAQVMQRAEQEIALGQFIEQLDLPTNDDGIKEELDMLFSGTLGEEVSLDEAKSGKDLEKEAKRIYCAFEKEDGKHCGKRLEKGRTHYCKLHEETWPKDDK